MTKTVKFGGETYNAGPKGTKIKNVGVELDFCFDPEVTSIKSLAALKKAVTQLAKEVGVKPAKVIPLNVNGPGGGNPNAIIVFKNLTDAITYCKVHNRDPGLNDINDFRLY